MSSRVGLELAGAANGRKGSEPKRWDVVSIFFTEHRIEQVLYPRKSNCNLLVLDVNLSSIWHGLEFLREVASVDGDSTTHRLGAVGERATADAAEFAGDDETRVTLYNIMPIDTRGTRKIR